MNAGKQVETSLSLDARLATQLTDALSPFFMLVIFIHTGLLFLLVGLFPYKGLSPVCPMSILTSCSSIVWKVSPTTRYAEPTAMNTEARVILPLSCEWHYRHK